jgi:hypothetical protein
MTREQRRAIARGIIRNGSWLVPDASICTLEDVTLIGRLVMFPVHIVNCEVGGWGLECRDIMQERSNAFWWGQEAGAAEVVDEPIKWIKERSTYEPNITTDA